MINEDKSKLSAESCDNHWTKKDIKAKLGTKDGNVEIMKEICKGKYLIN